MPDAIPLDEQIVATLTADCTSDQAAGVLTLATDALRDLTAEAERADVDSLSPLATTTQATALRKKAGDLRFEADRMEASVAALDVRVAELRDRERADRRAEQRAQVTARRDALAVDVARAYPVIVRDLTRLAKRIVDSDAECVAFGLDSAEAIGRCVPNNFHIAAGVDMGQVRRIADLRIGMPSAARLAWGENGKWLGLGIPDPAPVASAA